MAMRMNHCTSCKKHFFLTDARCPHCGTAASGGPTARFVRQARMGGLMLFTALTTTACYGTPAMMDMPQAPRPGVEQPIEKVPTTPGTANMFFSLNGNKYSMTANLVKATINGSVLTLSAGRNGMNLLATIEADSAEAFAEAPGVREALPVEKMKKLDAEAGYVSPSSGVRTLVTFKTPSATLKGTLQLSVVDQETVGGTLLLSDGDRQITVYFLAQR